MADSFRDLLAWQKAMILVTDVYRATDSFPSREVGRIINGLITNEVMAAHLLKD